MDRRDTMALSILTTLIMEPAPPDGYDWVVNNLTAHLPAEMPHRQRLVHASVILTDSLIECLDNSPALPDDWPLLDDVPNLDESSDENELSPVDVGNLNTDD